MHHLQIPISEEGMHMIECSLAAEVGMCTCMYIFVRVCVCIHSHVCLCMHMCMRAMIYMYEMDVPVCVCLYVLHICVYMQTVRTFEGIMHECFPLIGTQTHTYVRKYTRVHTYACTPYRCASNRHTTLFEPLMVAE